MDCCKQTILIQKAFSICSGEIKRMIQRLVIVQIEIFLYGRMHSEHDFDVSDLGNGPRIVYPGQGSVKSGLQSKQLGFIP